MPELPEVEITARLLDRALRGAHDRVGARAGDQRAEDVRPAAGGARRARDRRGAPRGKHLIIDFATARVARRWLLIHLMSAGRLQLFDKRAGPRDRTSRLLVRLACRGRRARAAPARVRLQAGRLGQAAARRRARGRRGAGQARSGGLARPGPARAEGAARRAAPAASAAARPARDRRASGARGSTRSCGRPELSPFKRGSDLRRRGGERLREAIVETLGGAIAHYEQAVPLPIPDKLPMPLRVHRHEGEPARAAARRSRPCTSRTT